MPLKRLKDLEDSFERGSGFFQTTSSLDEAGRKLLQELGPRLDCQWGTFWLVDENLHQLRPASTWAKEGLDARRLERDTKSRTLSLSEGTAGHVWRSGKPIWTLDLAADMCLPRSLGAESSGLHGGIWFAIKTKDKVYAIIELLGENLVPPTQELLVGIESFGVALGRLLSEKRNTTA